MNETTITAMLDKAYMDGWLSAKERINELEQYYQEALRENQALKEKLERYEEAMYKHCVAYGVDDFCEGDKTCPLYPCPKFKNQAPRFKPGDRVLDVQSKRTGIVQNPPYIEDYFVNFVYDDNPGGVATMKPENLTKLPSKPEEVKSLVEMA